MQEVLDDIKSIPVREDGIKTEMNEVDRKISETFGSRFVHEYKPHEVKKCFRQMVNSWIELRKHKKPGLLILGDNGTGKTFLMVNIARRLLTDYIYWSTGQLLEHLNDTTRQYGIDKIQMRQQTMSRFIFLDDLTDDMGWDDLKNLREWMDHVVNQGASLIIASTMTYDKIKHKANINQHWRKIFSLIKQQCLRVAIEYRGEDGFACRDIDSSIEWR